MCVCVCVCVCVEGEGGGGAYFRANCRNFTVFTSICYFAVICDLNCYSHQPILDVLNVV